MQDYAEQSSEFQAKRATLIAQYAALCRYCDQAFAAARRRYPDQMRCAKGCAACCILETVVPLEAVMIAEYLASRAHSRPMPDEAAADQCAWLDQAASCRIYPARPIICRTHGLPLRYPDQLDPDICPLNLLETFSRDIDPQCVLDAERITTNLLRLNVAFCMLIGSGEAAGERISLRDLLAPSQHRSHILSRFLARSGCFNGLIREHLDRENPREEL